MGGGGGAVDSNGQRNASGHSAFKTKTLVLNLNLNTNI